MVGRLGRLSFTLAMLLGLMQPAVAKADVATTTTVMRPVADTFNNWLVKPGTGVGQAWTAIDDDVTEPTAVAATDWIWAGGTGRVAEVAMSYPVFGGMQPVSAAVKFYANTGATTQLRVETIGCGSVLASTTVAAGQGFAWRSLVANPAKLYCGQTGQDQRLRLRFTTVGGGDSNVRAAYISVGLSTSEKIASVMEYNLAERTTMFDPYVDYNQTGIAATMETIRSRSPDIVLLNEVLQTNIDLQAGFRPIQYLAQNLGYPYWYYQPDATIWAPYKIGTKGIAVMSRFPILNLQFYPIQTNGGILQTSMNIKGIPTEVFSLRFSPMHRANADTPDLSDDVIDPTKGTIEEWNSNHAGHDAAAQIIRSIPASHAIIMGGDFNANWRYAYEGPSELRTPWSITFRDTSGLKDSWVEYLRPYGPIYGPWDWRADYMYYRGPFVTKSSVMQQGYPGASDHGYVYSVLGYSQAYAEDLLNSGGSSMQQ